MSDEMPEWQTMWGAKVKLPVDMEDDMLRHAVETCKAALEEFPTDEEAPQLVEKVKKLFDERWTPYWHVIFGRNFGSWVTHETRCFLYFYIDDKAFMLFKAG